MPGPIYWYLENRSELEQLEFILGFRNLKDKLENVFIFMQRFNLVVWAWNSTSKTALICNDGSKSSLNCAISLVVEMQVEKLQLKYREGRFCLQGDLAFFNSVRKHLAIAHYIPQRGFNPYKISLRGHGCTGVFSSFIYSFMLFFSYKIGPFFAFYM